MNSLRVASYYGCGIGESTNERSIAVASNPDQHREGATGCCEIIPDLSETGRWNAFASIVKSECELASSVCELCAGFVKTFGCRKEPSDLRPISPPVFEAAVDRSLARLLCANGVRDFWSGVPACTTEGHLDRE